MRAYVTVTTPLLRSEDPAALDADVAELDELMVRAGRDEQPPATAVLGLELATHEGHVMGRGVNRLLLYEHAGQAFLHAAGTWDEMPLTLERAYRWTGRQAQSAFWDDGPDDSSMLVQIAERGARR